MHELYCWAKGRDEEIVVEGDQPNEANQNFGQVLGSLWLWYVLCSLRTFGQVSSSWFRPDLKEKPCAVGGKNSVLCTANYEARKYGLRAAMPSFIAL